MVWGRLVLNPTLRERRNLGGCWPRIYDCPAAFSLSPCGIGFRDFLHVPSLYVRYDFHDMLNFPQLPDFVF